MKRILSIALCVMMLASLFCVNTSAAIPTAVDKTINTAVKEAAIAEPQTYSDVETYSFFNSGAYASEGLAIVNEDPEDAESNLVKEIKYVPVVYDEAGTTVISGPDASVAQLNTGNQKTDILSTGATIPATYMVEFDVCAKNNSTGIIFTRRGKANGVQAGLGIDPDTMTVGTWYTYRLYVDESGYRAVEDDGSDEFANNARSAFLSGTTAYRKVRGSESAFEDVTSSLTIVTSGNAAMGFNLNAGNRYMLKDGTDTTKDTVGTVSNVYKEAFDACYHIDNIGVYNYTIPADYEINKGVLSTYDMESVTTAGSTVVFAAAEEADGNGYMEIYAGTPANVTASNPNLGYSGNYAITSESSLSDKFVLNFDANNMVAGFGLAMEIYSDYDGTDGNTFGRRKVIVESDTARANTWYSYKLVVDDSGNVNGMDIVAYRRLRGSNGPWELMPSEVSSGSVNSTDHDIFFNDPASGSSNRARTLRFGIWGAQLSAYATDATDGNGVLMNAKGKWAIDNIQFTEAAAVSGVVSETDATVSAEINVSGAAPSLAPIVAIYDGDVLVNLGTATVNGEGTVTVTCDEYTKGNTVMLYVWDSLSTGTPLLTDALDITALL